MKKTKLLPLLLAFPLLASCGVGSKLKAPKFAEPGKEIKYDTFVDNIEKLAGKLHVNDDKKQLPSAVFTQKIESYSESVHKKSNKEVERIKGGYTESSEFKYDSKNHLIEESEASKDKYTGKQVTSKGATSSEYKSHSSYQALKDGKNTYVVRIEKETKEYFKEATVDKDFSVVDYSNSFLKEKVTDEFINVVLIMMIYEAVPEKEQKNFKFYQKDKLFTAETTLESEEDVLDIHAKKIGKNKSTYTFKVQCDLVNEKLVIKSWTETIDEYTISKTGTTKIDGGTVLAVKDDSYVFTNQSKNESSFVYKDVKLKEVKLDKYTKIGAAW